MNIWNIDFDIEDEEEEDVTTVCGESFDDFVDGEDEFEEDE